MPGFFVTGTDTDVGKTIAAAWLTLQLGGVYYKPVQSGIAEGMGDLEHVQALTGLSAAFFHPSDVRLLAPLSPHEAARREGVQLHLEEFALPSVEAPLIVEGAGGVLVPLNDKDLMIDLIARFGLPVVVVARSGLGTINHTVLTLEALAARGLPVAGVIMNGPPNTANLAAIEYYGKTRVLAELPPFEILDKAHLLAAKPRHGFETWI